LADYRSAIFSESYFIAAAFMRRDIFFEQNECTESRQKLQGSEERDDSGMAVRTGGVWGRQAGGERPGEIGVCVREIQKSDEEWNFCAHPVLKVR